jgi:hypothetical protein
MYQNYSISMTVFVLVLRERFFGWFTRPDLLDVRFLTFKKVGEAQRG